MKTVEVLFFDGCPNVEIAIARAHDAITRAGAPADLHLVCVESDDDAIRRRFLGSPSVRVDGLDVDDSARARSDFGLQCRIYSIDGCLAGAPPEAWIEAKLRAEPSARTDTQTAATSCCSTGARKYAREG